MEPIELGKGKPFKTATTTTKLYHHFQHLPQMVPYATVTNRPDKGTLPVFHS